MAKYDREILVPYLQDICALHFAELEVGAKMFGTQKKILQLKAGREIEPPAEPAYEDEWDWFSGLVAGAGVFLLSSPLIMLLDLFFSMGSLGLTLPLAFIATPLGFFLWKISGAPVMEAKKYNQQLYEQYQEDLKRYQKQTELIEAKNQEARKDIPKYERRLNYLSAERRKIHELLEMAYGVGVLPTQYRDIYAAVYLYDYFSNSRADDLDQVLNTYVLEQIKDKLDTIIENQRISILNQRLIMVNQQRALEEQRVHNEYMRKKIRKIASSVEEQKQYLNMVECNTAATAYFAAARYLR